MSIDNGGPAFPPMHNPNTHEFGMTIRDYFAAKAMQSMQLADYQFMSDIARDAYQMADAMIAARTK